jgi:hypothetical protein
MAASGNDGVLTRASGFAVLSRPFLALRRGLWGDGEAAAIMTVGNSKTTSHCLLVPSLTGIGGEGGGVLSDATRSTR